MNEATLRAGDLVLVASLVVLNAGLSLWLQLGLARTLLIAASRTVVQLLLVGLLLKTVLTLQSGWLVGGVVLLMFAAASHEILSRQDHRLAGWWGMGLSTGATMAATLLATTLALIALRPSSWLDARVLIPLLGIILGGVMNGVSLSLNTFQNSVQRDRSAIEARLTLGATRHEALRPTLLRALRSGMIPIVNQMSAAGIITLPGMMSGQILAGMPAIEAAKYQILVLLLIAGGAGLGAIGATLAASWRLTDERDRLRLDRLG
ncbi:ABC transporter permease [Aquabacterium sp.]|uniref:ABC transporter permease n=1 Tax=Aquabacterium sp. TaxID=1872578 RepID=UPI0035AEB95E